MTTPTHFTFLLLPGFNLEALGASCAVLAEEAGHIPFVTAGLEGKTVTASCGVRVRPDDRAEEVEPGSTLVVLSARDLPEEVREAALVVIRRARRGGSCLWGVGEGVLMLALAGLPDGAQVVAHPDLTAQIRAKARRVEILHEPFLWTEGMATARAVGAAGLMRHALARRDGLTGRVAETARAQLLPVEDRYDTTQATVLSVLNAMRDNLFHPVPIGALAATKGLSYRKLERLFERELGESPAPIYREMRMEAARIEVREGRRPMGDIARDFGVTSAGFSKTYLKEFGVAPSADRRASVEGGLLHQKGDA